MDADRHVIELINRLQGYRSTGCKIDIQLPQIVVVGAQSSGKSSVLDGLIGASILPRGSGTVTKCPIIVQLTTTYNSDDCGIEFQEDDNANPGAPPNRIQDFDVVRDRISQKMNANNGAITDTPIIIRVFSPDVVTLTVVDLPGIKRLTSSGEPSDLEQLIFNMSRKYINEKNAIILAVSPANYDICNSDGILLAKEADPEGKRTIGVLTKLDLMDEGTNARELLTGTSRDVRVELGMIGLVNRSQKDIDNNLSVEKQLEKEKSFLENNYPDLASQNGVPYLRKRLHDLLVQHINKCLPDILQEMEDLLEICEKRLSAIPDVMTAKDKQAFINKIIYRFETNVKVEIEGCTRSPEYKYLYGGIRIKDAFEKLFPKDMDIAGKMSEGSITDNMIINAFRNSGSYDSFFGQPEAVFRKLAQKQVTHLEEPALKCAKRVYAEIQTIASRNLKKEAELENFPALRMNMTNVVIKMVESKLDNLESHIKDYIKIQSGSVLSLDPKLLKTLERLRRDLEKIIHADMDESDTEAKKPSGPIFSGAIVPNVPEKIRKVSMFTVMKKPEAIEIIKKMANTYFNHIKSQSLDYIPKLISDRLITQFSSDGSLGEELRTKIFEHYEELAKLPESMYEQRVQNVERKQQLQKIIYEIRETVEHTRYDDEDGESYTYEYEASDTE